jgi:hypothetical protein
MMAEDLLGLYDDRRITDVQRKIFKFVEFKSSFICPFFDFVQHWINKLDRVAERLRRSW